MPERTLISLPAGQKESSGQWVYEEVLVDRVGPDKYLVVATPGLVLGIARGDRIQWDGGTAAPRVTSRGGDLAVQVYGPHEIADEVVGRVAGIP